VEIREARLSPGCLAVRESMKGASHACEHAENTVHEESVMSATLQVSRPSSLVDFVWPYSVVVDGESVGRLSNGAQTSLDVTPGTHTLQMRSRHIVLGRLGFSSPALSFEATEGKTTSFRCRPRTLREVPAGLKAGLAGTRTTWIGLEPS
jgi:hypothetical protein